MIALALLSAVLAAAGPAAAQADLSPENQFERISGETKRMASRQREAIAAQPPVDEPLFVRSRYEGWMLQRLLTALAPYTSLSRPDGALIFWKDGRFGVTLRCETTPRASCVAVGPGRSAVIERSTAAELLEALATVPETKITRHDEGSRLVKYAAIDCTGDQASKRLDSCTVTDVAALTAALCAARADAFGVPDACR